MGNLFGKQVPLKEVLRENKRMINRAIRELDRERAGLEREEKRIVSFRCYNILSFFLIAEFSNLVVGVAKKKIFLTILL